MAMDMESHPSTLTPDESNLQHTLLTLSRTWPVSTTEQNTYEFTYLPPLKSTYYQLSTEIESLESRLALLESRRRDVADLYNLTTSVCSPIRLAPYDILVRIFQIALDASPSGEDDLQKKTKSEFKSKAVDYEGRCLLWSLSHVCSAWYYIVRTTPLLWSGISLDMTLPATPGRIELLKLYLSRSRQIDLTVELRFDGDRFGGTTPLCTEFVNTLFKEDRRFRAFHFSGHVAHFFRIHGPGAGIVHSTTTFPRLRSLAIGQSLSPRYQARGEVMPRLFPCTPNLTKLSISYINAWYDLTPLALELPLTSVKSLGLGTSLMVFALDVLRVAGTDGVLEELSLSRCYNGPGGRYAIERMDNTVASVELPTLKKLRIRNFDAGYMLGYLSLPAVESLELNVNGPRAGEEVPVTMERLVEVVKRVGELKLSGTHMDWFKPLLASFGGSVLVLESWEVHSLERFISLVWERYEPSPPDACANRRLKKVVFCVEVGRGDVGGSGVEVLRGFLEHARAVLPGLECVVVEEYVGLIDKIVDGRNVVFERLQELTEAFNGRWMRESGGDEMSMSI